jgi:hypothetical protein
MAERLDSFPVRRSHARSKYPWDEWLDGSVWRLTQGEDFTAKLKSMRVYAATTADRRGLKVRMRIDNEDNTLTIQAWSPNGNGAA